MVKVVADGPMPTDYGMFHMFLFRDTEVSLEHIAMVFGNVSESKDAVVRVHSACITGEVFGANNCDCRQQLDKSLQMIATHGTGALLYLDQEGRGNGLEAKLKTFDLIVNKGIDPNQAFKLLGYPEDLRDYSVAAEMLKALGINYPIKLLTNNPRKVEDLIKAGMNISERIDLFIPPSNKMMEKNFLSKRDDLGHHLPDNIKVDNG